MFAVLGFRGFGDVWGFWGVLGLSGVSGFGVFGGFVVFGGFGVFGGYGYEAKGLRLRGSGVGVITRSPSTSKWIPAYRISTF